jgi:hypothetical protein
MPIHKAADAELSVFGTHFTSSTGTTGTSANKAAK